MSTNASWCILMRTEKKRGETKEHMRREDTCICLVEILSNAQPPWHVVFTVGITHESLIQRALNALSSSAVTTAISQPLYLRGHIYIVLLYSTIQLIPQLSRNWNTVTIMSQF